MKSDEAQQWPHDEDLEWHYADCFIPLEELETEPLPPPGWIARFWPAVVAAWAIVIITTVWFWLRQELSTEDVEQVTPQEISLIEARLLDILPPRQIGEDPTQRQLPAELVGKARLLLGQGDDTQNVLAKIALKNDNGADFTIHALKQEPVTLAFRLITLEGHNWYNAGEFDRAVKSYEQALALQPEDADALRNAAIAHSQAKQGDIAAHKKRAVGLLKQAVAQAKEGSALWCELQNNLGLAWMESLDGDRADNLRQAIAAFRSAPGILACDGDSALRAKLQANLGIAWLAMDTGHRMGNLHNAIDAFRSALGVYTRDGHPLEWALTQNKLGKALLALADLRTGDAGENLAQAVAAFRAALELLVRDEHPLEWAEAQNNLGLALDRLPTGEADGNRRQAIAAFQAAEKVYNRTLHPTEWAATRFNQAVVLRHLADTAVKGCDHLWQSVAYLKAAASVWTQEAYPVPHKNQILPFTQAVGEAWTTRGCGTAKALDGIPAAK